MKITFCIPSKNNLRYLKNSIASIKQNSFYEHDIIVFIDADNDGTENWCKENNITYLKNTSNSPQGIAFGYNRCIEAATTDIICMFHADMYMAKGFDTGILKYLKPKSVVSGTRIEPPLHPDGLEKIVKNFGMYPEDFNENEFNKFIDNILVQNKDKTTKGIFAPWAIYKEDIVNLGMHDEYFHSYHEDSDIFNRFILSSYDIIQSWEAYVYHLTCRGGQFQDGIGQITSDPKFHIMKTNAARNYLRKWGSWIKNDEYQYPIIPRKYNVSAIIHNCKESLLELLEPWFTNVYVTNSFILNRDEYIRKEQVNTSFDLNKRVHEFNEESFSMDNIDILIEFDANQFNQQSFNIIQNLSDIINDSGEIGKFKLDIFGIHITNLQTYEKELIKL
jgi:glycosyltransferase involved in cell wall biosynthesis